MRVELAPLAAAYATVLLAEIVGDKSVYTIGSLAVRFRAAAVACGLASAFCLKMLAAVLLGSAVAALPATPIAVVSACTFFGTAVALWRRGSAPARIDSARPSFPRAAAVSFASVFFVEWGDVGQIAAATLAAQYAAPVSVWLGATLALVTKGTLALALGIGLLKRVSEVRLKVAAVALCVVLGILSLWPLVAR